MSIRARIAIPGMAVLLIAAAAGQPTAAAARAPLAIAGTIRADASQLPAIDLEGGSRYLERSARGKILVVNFWASWCGPCREELPSLDRLAARRKDIVVVAASVDTDHGEAVKAFAGRYPHLLLAFSAFADVRGYGALGTPYSVIFDRRGREVARVPRALDWSDARTAALLKRAQ